MPAIEVEMFRVPAAIGTVTAAHRRKRAPADFAEEPQGKCQPSVRRESARWFWTRAPWPAFADATTDVTERSHLEMISVSFLP
jgi:hypothetical protein